MKRQAKKSNFTEIAIIIEKLNGLSGINCAKIFSDSIAIQCENEHRRLLDLEMNRKRLKRQTEKPAKELQRKINREMRRKFLENETHRTCSACETNKPIEDFKIKNTLCKKCKNCRNTLQKERYAANQEYFKKRSKDYRAKNLEACRSSCIKYTKLNRKSINARRRARIAENPEEKIVKSLRDRLHGLVKFGKAQKLQKTYELYGCSLTELKMHLESMFKPGMHWGNYGFHGWHIDHIIPCDAYDLTKLEEQRKCFNYKNLRPEWRFENQSKGNKILHALIQEKGMLSILPESLIEKAK